VYLRTRADADVPAARVQDTGDIFILGGGFIGCEVAAAARSFGAEVTVLEMRPSPLEAVLGPEVGEAVGRIHRSAGVRLRTGERVQRVGAH
jgi:3-phenylpropionate/trans-cinnamate dioxygenase ferredoxin reductase subunit